MRRAGAWRTGAWLAAAGCAGLVGCAWGPGEPFGELATTLDARWAVAPGRDAGDGWQRLASDYQVRLERATWTTARLVFVASAVAALDFDPSMPPPGYTLCHNGHCHAVDGRLVSYEDIAAELSGGGPVPPALVLATGGDAVDLVAGARVELGCDGAPCTLGRGTIGRVELEVTGLAITGAVRDGRTPPRRPEAAFTAEVAAATAPLRPTGQLELRVDRANDPEIRLAVGAHPGAQIFDGVDWTAVLPEAPAGEAIDLAATPAAIGAVTTSIGELALALELERGAP